MLVLPFTFQPNFSVGKWWTTFVSFLYKPYMIFQENYLILCLNNVKLKLHWFDLHFCPLGRVIMSFPVIPVDTISTWWMFSMMIQTVQVWMMTVLVPPGSFVGHSTVVAPAVIILIFRSKGVTTMTRKRITSISCKIVELWEKQS